jgi:hypothetical protein
MPDQNVVLRTDLPEIYRKAADASAKSQDLFLVWNLITIAALTLAALILALKGWLHSPGAVAGAVMLAAGAVMTFWLRKSRYERRWYSSRAVAESVKTLSWRYMMRASPFAGGSPHEEAQAAALFETFVHDIADQEAAPVPKPHEITDKMREMREKTPAERAETYLRARYEPEREWYDTNSKKNSRNGSQVLSLAIATQIIACGLALIQIFHETPDFVGVFATASAGALAWLQTKRYEDLAQAYMTAAKELSRIGSTVTVAAISDAELSRFVLDSENTISREHTLWLAKRS